MRAHRSVLVNLDFVQEFHAAPDAAAHLRLKDGTELPVARDRTKALKQALGLGSGDSGA